jgi:hypothetical protein
MCGACGILQGGFDWIDGHGEADAAPHERLAERRRRLALVNMLLEGSGVSLGEHGRQLVLRSATGTTRLVGDLAHVWRAADEIGRRPADPLDPRAPLFDVGTAR